MANWNYNFSDGIGITTAPNPNITPLNLLQTWKTHDLPKSFQSNREKWIEATPEFNHILYDDKELRDLVATNFPQYLSFYDNLRKNIERVDFARYVMMYSVGGVYADLDTVPIKDIKDWTSKNVIVLGREPLEHANAIYNRDVVLCNALMISPPGQQVWIDFMDFIVSNYSTQNPVWTTGPMAMTLFYEKSGDKWGPESTIITSPCVFFPLTNVKYSNKTEGGFEHVSKHCDINEAYTAHMWSNSWLWPDLNEMSMYILLVLIVLGIVSMAYWYKKG